MLIKEWDTISKEFLENYRTQRGFWNGQNSHQKRTLFCSELIFFIIFNQENNVIWREKVNVLRFKTFLDKGSVKIIEID